MKSPVNYVQASGFALTALLATACAGGVGQISQKTMQDPEAQWGQYETWAFAGSEEVPSDFTRAKLSPEMREIAVEAAVGRMQASQWEQAPIEEADVIFRAGVGRRTRTEKRMVPGTSGGVGATYGLDAQEVEANVTDGTIVVDAFERSSGRHIWHGSLDAQIMGRDVNEEDRESFRTAVDKLFADFPKAAPSASGDELTAKTSGGEEADAKADDSAEGEAEESDAEADEAISE